MSWTFWSSVGFWILMVGLIGDFAVLFIRSGKLEKRLAISFTILIALGVALEHFADAKKLAPRVLTVAQQRAIIRKIMPFAKTPFVLGVDPGPEAIDFMSQVDDTLIKAGWKWEAPEHDKKTGLIITLGPLKAVEWHRSGIVIGFREEGRNILTTPADRLATALEDEGFRVETGIIPDTISNNPDAVYVVIGSK